MNCMLKHTYKELLKYKILMYTNRIILMKSFFSFHDTLVDG